MTSLAAAMLVKGGRAWRKSMLQPEATAEACGACGAAAKEEKLAGHM